MKLSIQVLATPHTSPSLFPCIGMYVKLLILVSRRFDMSIDICEGASSPPRSNFRLEIGYSTIPILS